MIMFLYDCSTVRYASGSAMDEYIPSGYELKQTCRIWINFWYNIKPILQSE
jgi:hypothetical protein